MKEVDFYSWSKKAYFDEEDDKDLLEKLTQYPPTMPAGYRLPPIIETLSDN